MPTVTRTFTVTPPPAVVVPYLADFAHAEAWDPGTETCTRRGDGPVQAGAVWDNTSKIAGITTDLVYTLEDLSDEKIVLVGRNDTATSADTIEVVADGGGSRITYTSEVQMHGAAKLADPVIKLLFERLGNETVEQMTGVLNGLPQQ